MAATNYTPIQLYHSTTASAVPVNTNLVNGELAINITDGKLYYKDNGGTVQVIASKGTGTIGGSTTQVQYNLSGALAGSSNFTFNGTTATINTLNLTNALGATYGGTAQSSWTTGDLLYASGSNTLAKLGIGLNTYILTSNGSIPGWAAPSAISVNTATNLAGGAAGSVPYQSGAGATTFLSIGTANQVVTSTGSAPQWSSGLSITTLTASDAVTFSATTQNIALGTSQTSGTFTVGGTAQTGNIAIDRSTKTHTLNIGTGITESGQTKTINIGTAGDTGSTTAITIGSTNGTTITINGTVNASTLDLTNLEVTNIKAKDGTASMSIADSTGVVSITANPVLSGGTANGVLYLDGSKVATSDANLTYNGSVFAVGTGANTRIVDAVGASNGVSYRLRNWDIIGCDTGTGLTLGGLTGSQWTNLQVFTSGTEKLRITSGGQVNIGGNFTSTNNTLQVTGNAAIGDTLAGPTDGLYVKGSLGVGVNNNPSGAKLHVVSNGAAGPVANTVASAFFGESSYTGGAGKGITLGYNTSTGNSVFFGSNFSGAGFDWLTFSGTWGTRMTLDAAGNLGVGTTSPKMEVQTKASGGLQAASDLELAIRYNMYNSGGDKYIQAANKASSLVMDLNGSFLFYNTNTASTAANSAVTGLAERARIDSGGTFRVKGAGTAGSTDAVQFSGSAPASAMTLDSSGNLLVGATASGAYRFKAVGTGGNLGGNAYYVGLIGDGSANSKGVGFGYDSSSQTGVVFAETASAASNLAFWTYSGSAWGERARITSGGYFKASDTGTYIGSTSTEHEFYQSANDNCLRAHAANASYTADGVFTISAARNTTNNSFYALTYYNVGASAYKFQIADSGSISTAGSIQLGDAGAPPTSGVGVKFPATQSASSDANTLDDYEEGTWNPNLFSQSGANPTFTSSGVYTKVGNLVTAIGKITLTSTAGSVGYYIDGFPFGSSSATEKQSAYATEVTTYTTMAIAFSNNTTMLMTKYDGTFYGANGYEYRVCLQFTV